MRGAALCFALALGPWLGAQQIAVRGPEPAVVRDGEEATVTVVVDAPDVAELGGLPAVDGLVLTAGSRTATRVQTCVDGRLADQTCSAWPIRVTARRPGVFTIPPFSASAGGSLLTTAAVRFEAVAEPCGSEQAFVELRAERSTCILHEEVVVRVRFGFAPAFAKDNLVPLFARPLQVPAQVRASFAAGLPHTVVHGGDSAPGAATFALNEEVATATPLGEIERDGRVFVAWEFARTLVPTHTGELVVPGPRLRFAYATRFADDFVHGRVAVDHREGCVGVQSLVLRVDPWPADEQPAEFTGAVGRFTVSADASPRRVPAGGTVQLTLRIEGDGDLTRFAAPRLPLADFHLLGKVESTAEGARTIRYDLRPRRAGASLPAIAFAFFDPASPAGYRRVETEPIVLEVAAETSEPRPAPTPHLLPGENDIFDLASTAAERGSAGNPAPATVAVALLAPWLLAGLLALHLRRRDRARADPLGERARQAAAAFRAQAATPGADLGDALVAFLAARLRCPPAAVIGLDLAARLQGIGIEAELARRAARAVEQHGAARYGGTPPAGFAAEARALVEALEAAFRRKRER